MSRAQAALARKAYSVIGVAPAEPKTLHKERLGNRRQRREPPVGQKRPVCGKYMHMRVEVRQIPEGLHEQDQWSARTCSASAAR